MHPIYKFFLNKSSGNALAPMLMSKGLRLNTSNGLLVSDASYQTSMFMPVDTWHSYALLNSNNYAITIPYYAFYNQNKAFLSGGTGGVGAPITPPANAAFARISFSIQSDPADYSFKWSNLAYTAYISQQAFPIYRDDLAKEFARQTNEQFFRAALSGNLRFESVDYDWIVAQSFDFRFLLDIYISYDAGQTWESYFTGEFWKTDCKFNLSDKTVDVRPAVVDQYTNVLNALERQFNVIELAPAMRRVLMNKPPVFQFYNAGDNVITCVVPGRVWTVECEPVRATDTEGGVNKLTEYLHFGNIIAQDSNIYARILTDAATISGQPTFILPSNDMITTRRTHGRVYPYTSAASFTIGEYYTSTPTKYGLFDSVYYYAAPVGDGYLPIIRNKWDAKSYWFRFSQDDLTLYRNLTTSVETIYNYAVGSVIQKILASVSPDVMSVNSHFLGDTINPITGIANMFLLMSPKSDVMTAGTMDYPAQKAEISLREIFDMLRDCFRCYWYIDTNGTLWIEHIKYFMNGSYSGTPGIGVNLMQSFVRRTGKALSFGQGAFQYDKPAMAARYNFGWMDDVTEPFNGQPIEIVSAYVDKSNTEDIRVAKFTSDVDYIMVGDDVSKEGFALLNSTNAGVTVDSVPYWNNYQNGYLSFDYLQTYYAYDMPARYYKIGSATRVAQGIKKLKLQDVTFPALADPDLYKIIRTEVGNGVIEKLSVNLSSRSAKATLKYDTE